MPGMSRLNREAVVWGHPSGAVAYPIEYFAHDVRTVDADLPPIYADEPDEFQPVTFGGCYPRGTPVEDVVDLGANNRISCVLGGQRVTTVKWAISDVTSELGSMESHTGQ